MRGKELSQSLHQPQEERLRDVNFLEGSGCSPGLCREVAFRLDLAKHKQQSPEIQTTLDQKETEAFPSKFLSQIQDQKFLMFAAA